MRTLDRESDLKYQFILILFLTSCDGGTLWKDGEHEIIWIDSSPPYLAKCDAKINMCQGITGERVLSIGSNDKYIVAEFQNKLNGQSDYYVISKKYPLPVKYYSPYTLEQYKLKELELNLPELNSSY